VCHTNIRPVVTRCESSIKCASSNPRKFIQQSLLKRNWMDCCPGQYFLGAVHRDIFGKPCFENGFVLRHTVNAVCCNTVMCKLGMKREQNISGIRSCCCSCLQSKFSLRDFPVDVF
jgi:hypothetical protein